MNNPRSIVVRTAIGFILLLQSTGHVMAVIDIPIDANNLSLKESSLLFTDTDNQYSSLSSLLADNIDFIPLLDKPPVISNASHWIKIELHNPYNQSQTWYLGLGFPSLIHLHAYWHQAGKVTTISDLNADSTYAERSVDEPLLFLPLNLAAAETKTLYLHYKSLVDVPLDLKIISASNFVHYRQQENSINNFLLGFMLAFFCVISVQWMLSHNLTYLYYAALVLCMTLIVSDMSGYNFKYLWPEYGSWALYVPPVIFLAIALFYLLFVREFLSLKNKNHRLYQIYTGFILLAISIFIFNLFSNTPELFILLGILIIPLLIFTSFWAIKQQLASAKIFSLSIVSHVFFVYIMFFGSGLGFVFFSDMHLTIYPKLGYALEVLFFTVALAVQNRQLRLTYTKSLQNRLVEAETLALVEKENTELLAETQNRILQFATTTHDLAQPLSSIRMAIEALPKDTEQKIKKHIDKTVSYAEQLLRSIIRDAKSDFSEKNIDVALSDIFQQAMAQHKRQADVKRIALRYFPSRRHICVLPQSLLRILDNLLANAIRYTNKGRVFLGVRQKSGRIEIQVWDTGVGIDSTTLKRLLQPFEQSGQIEVEKQGFGLGLYIVKVLCEKSGYQLSIHSERGKGSCFSISIETDPQST